MALRASRSLPHLVPHDHHDADVSDPDAPARPRHGLDLAAVARQPPVVLAARGRHLRRLGRDHPSHRRPRLRHPHRPRNPPRPARRAAHDLDQIRRPDRRRRGAIRQPPDHLRPRRHRSPPPNPLHPLPPARATRRNLRLPQIRPKRPRPVHTPPGAERPPIQPNLFRPPPAQQFLEAVALHPAPPGLRRAPRVPRDDRRHHTSRSLPADPPPRRPFLPHQPPAPDPLPYSSAIHLPLHSQSLFSGTLRHRRDPIRRPLPAPLHRSRRPHFPQISRSNHLRP